MIGQMISQYKILEKLGEGGMGVVYKADDTKLKRTVALKFLPQHVSSTPEEEARFLQEAQAAATLNHPNVCTIYDIKEYESQQFIVMECVEGVTLRKMISSAPLSLEKVIPYALQIGDALTEAHNKGIVHRDIKADNIMVNSKNNIKVMDFGLAKLKGSLKLTRSSSTVGTLAYMAPEQIQGGEVDARSDIFSFGVVVYEMLTGHMPFRGDHEAAMMYSILNEEPEPLDKYLPEAPSELLHIFSKVFEKNPEDRYQSVHDMVIDLRRLKKESTKVSRASVPVMRPTSPVMVAPPTQPLPAETLVPPRPPRLVWPLIALAVVVLGVVAYFFLQPKGEQESGTRLPVAVADFVNQTDEKELDGLSGMLITSMEQSKRLSVLTRSRMFDILKSMGNTNVDKIDESLGKAICMQANVNALVTASIRKFGKLYTIDLKVLDPKKNEYIFTAKEEGEGQENIPGMLDRLSEKTRKGLKDQASESTTAKVAVVTTSNLEAYQHYFQGEQLINRLNFEEAQKELRKAVELDSTFGLAWYRLAYAISWNQSRGGSAGLVLEKALTLTDRLPEKERFLLHALKAEDDGDFTKAVHMLKEMEKNYPDDKEMMYNIGDWSYHANDTTAASTYLEKVLKVDPTFERALQHLTWTYRDMGRYEKMVEIAKRYVSASSSDEAYGLLNDGYMMLGQFDQAMKAMQSARELFPKRYSFTGSIAQIYRYQRKFEEAEKELNVLTAPSQPPEARAVGFDGLTGIYMYRGQVRNMTLASDERMKLLFSANDTVGAINHIVGRAIADLTFRKDDKSAQKEIEHALMFHADMRPQTKTNLSVWYAYQGDVNAVDTLNHGNKIAQQIILLIAYSNKHQCDKAEVYLDSINQLNLPANVKILCLPLIGKCQLEGGQAEKALATMNKLQAMKEFPGTNDYPRGVFLLGKIYEMKGERKLAIENYEKFILLWKDADKDLPDLIEAKARLSKLKGIVAR